MRKCFKLVHVLQLLVLAVLFVGHVSGQDKKVDDVKVKEDKIKKEKAPYLIVVDDGSRPEKDKTPVQTVIIVSGWKVLPLKSKIIGTEISATSETKDGLTTIKFPGRVLRLKFSLPKESPSIQYWGETKGVVVAVPNGAAINPPAIQADPKKGL